MTAVESELISVSRVDPRSEECLLLNEHSWVELSQLYRDLDRTEFFALDFRSAGSAFVVARQDERALGCGAIRPFAPEVAEVKRIYVEPEARGFGIGRKILSTLEVIASELGYNALQLETGVRQPVAIRLYEEMGYQRIEAYGKYRDDPLSVCFAKTLTISAPRSAPAD